MQPHNGENRIKEQIPAYVTAVMEALSAAGHRGYLVGGSLRDLLRGEVPHDFDLTTDATPEEMCAAFSAFRVIPTGLKHGTVTVLSDGHPVEVTTHRTDGAYLDSRHPTSVSFTRRLEEDLSRRDFTVNAMAWGEEAGLVDLFGGREDLSRGIIRAVGDPVRRFREDALRILRAFRFSAKLNFSIEAETARAAAACREGLARISVERIFAELSALLEAAAAEKGLAALLAAGCAPFVFSDLRVDEGALALLPRLPRRAPLCFAALLRENTPEAVAELCRRLHTSNLFSHTVTGLLAAAAEEKPTTPYEARRYVVHHFHHWEDALCLAEAWGEEVAAARELCLAVCRDRSAVDLHRLAVNGKQLQEEVGVRREKTGELLLRLQDLVWQEPARNRKEQLLLAARCICEREEGFL